LSVLVGLGAATAGYAALRLRASARLARSSHPFDKLAQPEGARLLVVGDSTAEGTGASEPAHSLPGLLCRANPSLTVVNTGHAGARFGDFLSQLEGDERFDAVLILGGGNDVIRMTRDAALRDSIRRVAQRARVRADLVVFMPPGNLGSAPFFFPPWNWWMTYQSRRLHAIVSDEARANGALYVSLFREREDDPFARHPRRMNARDGLHPSDAGYELWQRELETQVQLSAKLRKIGRSAASRGSAF
jgi:lysophospholipase L1-like esterase